MFGNPGAALAAAGGRGRGRGKEGGGASRAPRCVQHLHARGGRPHQADAHRPRAQGGLQGGGAHWGPRPRTPRINASRPKPARAARSGAASPAIVDGEDPAAVAPEGEWARAARARARAATARRRSAATKAAAAAPPTSRRTRCRPLPPSSPRRLRSGGGGGGSGGRRRRGGSAAGGDAAPVHYLYADGPTAEEPASKEPGGSGGGCRRRGAGFGGAGSLHLDGDRSRPRPPATPRPPWSPREGARGSMEVQQSEASSTM